MNNLFQENKRSFLLLLGLLFLLLAVVYFLFFKPLANDRDSSESQVSTLVKDLEVLKLQVNEMEETEPIIETDIERKRLEKKLPAEPELRDFLLSLQEIELVSGSKIIDYYFTYDGSIPERQALEATEEDNDDVDQENQNSVEELEMDLEPEAEEVSPILELPGMPENVRLVTVSMELYSPDYDHLQLFLQEIEKQERVMMISYLEFEQPGELNLLETEDESIYVNIDVTTFYYEN